MIAENWPSTRVLIISEYALEILMGAGQGYDFAYLFPGLQKVVQAAGRVIRTTEDRGYVLLLDDRYSARSVKVLLPKWWEVCSFSGRPEET